MMWKTLIKIDDKNRTVFFPFGAFSKGIILNGRKEEFRIQQFINSFFIIGFGLVFCLGIIIDWNLAIYFSLILNAIYWVVVYKFLLVNNEYSTLKFGINEAYKKQAAEWNYFKILGYIFLGIIMTSMICFVYYMGHKPWWIYFAFIGVILCDIYGFYLLKLKIDGKKDEIK